MQEKWIIDENYKRSMELRFVRADLVIFLNFTQEFCIESVKNRQFKTGRVGLPDYFVDTDEGLDRLINHHIPRFEEMKQQNILPRIEKYKDKVLEFQNREQVNKFIASLKKP